MILGLDIHLGARRFQRMISSIRWAGEAHGDTGGMSSWASGENESYSDGPLLRAGIKHRKRASRNRSKGVKEGIGRGG